MQLSACGDLTPRVVGQAPSFIDSKIVTQIPLQTGEIHFNDVEGGHYVIWADDGKTYLPTQLDEAFQMSGLKIQFSGQVNPNLVSGAMMGEIIVLDTVEIVN